MKTFNIIYHSGEATLRKQLTEMGFKFKERFVFSGFYGTEFHVEKPRGKGATIKINQLYKMGFHYS